MGRALTSILRHPAATAIIALTVVLACALALYWFQPWKLWVDETVDEALPGSGMAMSADEPTKKQDPQARLTTLAEGTFRELDHSAEGRALVLENSDGDRFLRFEDFEVSNGPDLKVYLSSAPASSEDDAFDDDFVDLGTLKGNIGDQNYVIPPEVNLEKYSSAVIWCRRFSVGFAVADLN